MPHLRPRIAVIGHVEHVVIAPVPVFPEPGAIVHIDEPWWIPGGGGGVAFHQLIRSDAEVHLFTALGADDAGRAVGERLAATGAHIHAARRRRPHTRDVALVTPDGERTIVVVGEPLHPLRSDPLPWELLATCDAVYFTAQDPAILVAAREARKLVVTARRAEAYARSGVRADVIVGSVRDPREASIRADYAVPPDALVMTNGRDGGLVETAQGIARFAAATPPTLIAGSYGAGDTFAAALTWYIALDLPVLEACDRAALHAAAVLAGHNPLDHHIPLKPA